MVKRVKKQHNKLQKYEYLIHYCKCQYNLHDEKTLLGYKVCEDCYFEAMNMIYSDGKTDVSDCLFSIELNNDGKRHLKYIGTIWS